MRLSRFVERYWDIAWPGTPFIGGWALEAICDHLQAITEGKIKNLIINAPPGFSMSSITATFWPAWEWFDQGMATHAFATVSHSEVLARSTLGPLLRLHASLEEGGDNLGHLGIRNTSGGEKLAYGIGSAVCGARFDRVVFDEANDTHSSPTEMKHTADAFVCHWQCRVRPGGSIVIAQPRVADGDLTDHIVSQHNVNSSFWGPYADYVWLMIPMTAESSRVCETPIGWKDPRTHAEQLAWPERFSQPAIAELRLMVGQKIFDRRYQQLVMPDDSY